MPTFDKKNPTVAMKKKIIGSLVGVLIVLSLILIVGVLLFVLFIAVPTVIVGSVALVLILFILNNIFHIPFGNDVIFMFAMAVAGIVALEYSSSWGLLLAFLILVLILFDIEEYIDDRFVHLRSIHPVSSGQQPSELQSTQHLLSAIHKKIAKAMMMIKKR